MNYYLLVYDRRHGRIVEHESFDAQERARASRTRLDRMIQYRERPEIEVVLFGADSYEDLMKTHARYFKTPEEILAGVASVKPPR